jgi:hypothetical protein
MIPEGIAEVVACAPWIWDGYGGIVDEKGLRGYGAGDRLYADVAEGVLHWGNINYADHLRTLRCVVVVMEVTPDSFP